MVHSASGHSACGRMTAGEPLIGRVAARHALAFAIVAACACSWACAAESRSLKPGKVAWRSIGPGQFGAMFGVAISPHDSEVIVAGVDMGNAFMTRDGGKTWAILGRCGGKPFANPGYRGTWGVHFDPKRPERIWIGSTHGVYRTTDGGENWRLALGGDAGHVTHAITTDPTDPDIVYAAGGCGGRSGVSWSKGNVWKSVDAGESWKLICPGELAGKLKGRNWVTIAVDPQSEFDPGRGHSRVYLCGQGGFFVSEDAGDTWTSLEGSLPGGIVSLGSGGVHTSGICDLVLAPGQDHAALFATIRVRYTDPEKKQWLGGVYASNDRGRTWIERNNGLERSLPRMAKSVHSYSLIVSCPAKPKVMYWAAWNGVFKTDDAGNTWRKVTFLGTEWRKAPDFDGREVYWRLRRHDGNFDQSYYCAYGPANGLACSATDPQAVAYTDNAGVAVSFDGGEHWTEPGFEFGAAVWPGRFGDRPAMRLTHKVRSRGIQLTVPLDLAVDPFDPKAIAIGHCDIGMMISRDGGTWWEWAYDGILRGERNYIRTILYDPDVQGRLWTGGGGWGASGHVYQSDDGGRTFKIVGVPQVTAEAERSKHKLYVHALALDPTSPKDARTIYAGTDFGIYKTSDGGRTWENGTVGLESLPRIRHVVIDPIHVERVYASAEPSVPEAVGAGLYRSEDSGVNWARLGHSQLGEVRSLSVCHRTGTLYAITHPPASAGYWAPRSLWRSDDHGETWQKLDDQLGACVAAHPQNPERVYYVTVAQDVRKDQVNVHRSTDGGKSWEAIADDIPLSPGGCGNKIVFDPSDPSRLFLLHNSGTYEGLEDRSPAPRGPR